MKKLFLVLFILILNSNKGVSNYGITSSYFSILATNGTNYEFLVVSTMSATSSSQCADMYIHPSSLSADTIYLRGFYDISGMAASAFCIAYDTINFQNIYPNANVINISTGVFWEDPINPGVYDSIWNIKDSNFNINPLIVDEQGLENGEGDFYFYPNPTNGTLTIHGRKNDLSDQIILYDMLGRVVATYATSSLPTTIDIRNLHDGLYMIQRGGKRKLLKVLKE